MENVADALKLAGAVLIFVMALSVAILAFTQAREGIDMILKYSDREYYTIKDDSRYYYLSSGLKNSDNTQRYERYVGKETIIPAIYRAYKENFKIIFNFPNTTDYLYKDTTKLAPNNTFTKIDLEQEGLGIGSDLDSRVFLYFIIYGTDGLNYNSEYKGIYDKKFKNMEPLKTGGLYQYITDNAELGTYKIKEELGTYYMEDIPKDVTKTEGASSLEDVNKNEKRVITYSFIHK